MIFCWKISEADLTCLKSIFVQMSKNTSQKLRIDVKISNLSSSIMQKRRETELSWIAEEEIDIWTTTESFTNFSPT